MAKSLMLCRLFVEQLCFLPMNISTDVYFTHYFTCLYNDNNACMENTAPRDLHFGAFVFESKKLKQYTT